MCKTKGVIWGVVLGMLALACVQGGDPATVCRHALEAKQDATLSCEEAYRANPSCDTERQLALAFLDANAADALLARYPRGRVAAELWHARGGRLREQNKVADSLVAFQRALELRDLTDTRGRLIEFSAISERYFALDNDREALVAQAGAYATAVALGDPRVLAHVRTNLAGQLVSVGDVGGAERVLGDSVERMVESDAYLAKALLQRGLIDLRRGRQRLAKQSFERAHKLAAQTGNEGDARKARINLVDVALELGDIDAADQLLAEDAGSAGTSGNEGATHALSAVTVALARGRLDDAARIMTEALAANPPDAWRWQLAALQGAVFERQGHEALAIAALEHAIDDVERARDRLELDELKAWVQAERRAPYDELFLIHARANRTLEALDVVQRANARSFLDGLANTESPIAIRDTADQLAVRAGVRAESLRIVAGALRVSTSARPPPAAVLVRSLADRSVWTYFVAGGRVWLLVLERGAVAIDDLGPLAQLRALIRDAGDLDEAALRRLGGVLVPAGRRLGGLIHIAADPPLDRVPFAALVVRGRRLIELTSISYVPSAAVLATLEARDPPRGEAVVLGDPRGDLPGAAVEARETAHVLGVRPHLGAEATTAAALSAGGARVLAVAAHTELAPGGASLLLADGAVTTSQILEAGLAPALVVLASCASAAVDNDVWGALAGAFIAAGSATVIASRWALDDSGSRTLIAAMYAAGGLDHPAYGTAVAQRAAIASGVPVRIWAALVVLGLGESPMKGDPKSDRRKP